MFSGTGSTLPYSCYSNDTDRALAYQYEFNVNASDAAIGETWVRAGNTAGACALNYKYGPYVGTAATARDHMSVVDALDQDGLLHYYGMPPTSLRGQSLIVSMQEVPTEPLLEPPSPQCFLIVSDMSSWTVSSMRQSITTTLREYNLSLLSFVLAKTSSVRQSTFS